MGAEHKKLGVPGEEELARPRHLLLRDLRRGVLQGPPHHGRRRRRLGDGGGDLPGEVRLQGDRRAPPRRVPRLGDHDRPRAGAGQPRVPHALRRREVRLRRGRQGARDPPLRNTETGETRELEADATFIAIGHEPQSELVAGPRRHRRNAYVVTEGKSTRTNVPGVFAAGDLVDHTYRQAVTAAGSGCHGRARRRVVPARQPPGADAGGARRDRRPGRGAVGARAAERAASARARASSGRAARRIVM